MKKLFFVLALLLMALPINQALAGCLATQAECKSAWDLKAEAVAARDKSNYELAAQKYGEAAKAHPQEVYQALYLLNQEGCLVGKWNPAKGYRYDTVKGENNKIQAQTILDQVKTLLNQVDIDSCDFDEDSNGVNPFDRATNWLENAQDALNGKFH